MINRSQDGRNSTSIASAVVRSFFGCGIGCSCRVFRLRRRGRRGGFDAFSDPLAVLFVLQVSLEVVKSLSGPRIVDLKR
jgi:hypothetical protein